MLGAPGHTQPGTNSNFYQPSLLAGRHQLLIKMKNLAIFSTLLLSATLQAQQISSFSNNTPLLKRVAANELLHFNIQGPGKLEQIAISTKGSSNCEDLKNLRLFLAADKNSLKPGKLFAKPQQKAAEQMLFDGQLELQPGDNWFWLACEVDERAALLNRVQANLLYAVVDGKKLQNQASAATGGNYKRLGIALCKSGDSACKGYRIPGLAVSNKGTLLAVYDMRYDGKRDLQGHMDIGLSRSTDGGESWEPQRAIIDMGSWGGLGEHLNGVSDGSVTVDSRTNEIYVTGLWMHGLRDKQGNFIEGATEGHQHQWHGTGSTPGLDPKQTCQFLMVKSSDDGKTWSKPVNITAMVKKPEWWLFAPAPGNGITMKDGTLVIPTQGRDAKGQPFSNFIYSKDRGKSWSTAEPAKSNTTECAIVELSDGSLMLNMRDNRNYHFDAKFPESGRSICVTRDLGKSWIEHPGSRTVLPEPVCMASLISHDFGKQPGNSLPQRGLLFSNPPNKTKAGGRAGMTIKLSADDGSSWPQKWHVMLDEKGGAYSALASLNPHTIGIIYEGSGADLVFQKISIKEFEQPKQP